MRGSLTMCLLAAGVLMAAVGQVRADDDDHWHKGWHRGWGHGSPPPAYYYRRPPAYYAPSPPQVYYVPPPPPVAYGTPGISVTIPLH
jgi:hypothetical protein